MRLGMFVRVSGREVTRETLLRTAQGAERAGLDDIWVFDHLAIPREESEGSEGYYLESLAALAFLAGGTERIGLGTAVLVLPYRPPLLTAKWAATLQVLSNGRLQLGVGAGWMEAEFRALNVPHGRRGALTDEALTVLRGCFENDEFEANGQKFLFRPRPARPRLLVGGSSDAALSRAVRLGDAWLPIGLDDAALGNHMAALSKLAAEDGAPTPDVVLGTRLPLENPAQATDRLATLTGMGVHGVIHMPGSYDPDAFEQEALALAELRY